MSAPLLATAKSLASRMIGKYGATVVLTKVTPGAFDPLTETRGADTETAVAVTAVEQPYTPLMGVGLGLSFEQATAITADGRSFLMAAVDVPFSPAPGMTILAVDGRTWVIASVKTDAPDGAPILYTCSCKAA